MKILESGSEAETLRIGEDIGQRLHPPRTVLLYGELGSGKTLLTRGLVKGLGGNDPACVHSPSFTLVNQYSSRKGVIYHIDLYRLEGLRDLYSIGLEEILSEEALVIIEWAEKLLLHPNNPLTIRISVDPTTHVRSLEADDQHLRA